MKSPIATWYTPSPRTAVPMTSFLIDPPAVARRDMVTQSRERQVTHDVLRVTLERRGGGPGHAAERLHNHLPVHDPPHCRGAAPGERERPEQAVGGPPPLVLPQ